MSPQQIEQVEGFIKHLEKMHFLIGCLADGESATKFESARLKASKFGLDAATACLRDSISQKDRQPK
jgi:rRNA pseudouridine-1189 N-methylase Emg1 (Nep1/Mra1 family)